MLDKAVSKFFDSVGQGPELLALCVFIDSLIKKFGLAMVHCGNEVRLVGRQHSKWLSVD